MGAAEVLEVLCVAVYLSRLILLCLASPTIPFPITLASDKLNWGS